ncbi:MAG: SH3 domain-containing protein [Betaproteobacteria bacterium]|nr:SH3 domain-containing protein [Betaproteobacteria bacterium]MCL2885978.1 SH3 domain-containing protein [Betaproteobacteria bacterium]
MRRRLLPLLSALLLTGLAGAAAAAEFRSVAVPAAILYDTPSLKGQKLYLIKAQTPVEVIVRLEGWVKVRDAEGALAWIEASNLAEQRNLVVIAPRAEIRQAGNHDAPVVVELDKSVAVELLGPAAPGWVRVKHRDGATGFMHVTQVWGL